MNRPGVALERPLDVLPNLYPVRRPIIYSENVKKMFISNGVYQAVFSHILWVICDIT